MLNLDSVIKHAQESIQSSQNKKEEEIPGWIKEHFEIISQLKTYIRDMEFSGKPIDASAVQTLKECESCLSKVVAKVEATRVLGLLQPKKSTVDSANLLEGRGREIPAYLKEWHLNLGLLMNLYNRTEDPDLKKQLSFLALNYLAKVAPMSADSTSDSTLFDIGFFQEAMSYHREANTFEGWLHAVLDKQFAQPVRGKIYLTDSEKFDHLFPLQFNVVRNGDDMLSKLITHFTGIDPFDKYLESPFLIDLTDVLANDILTQGAKDKEEAFAQKFEKIKDDMVKQIDRVIEQLIKAKPDLKDQEQRIKIFIKSNLTFVCRTKVKNLCALKIVPLFNQLEDFDKARKLLDNKSHRELQKIEDFINLTGIRVGAINARKTVFDYLSLEELIQLGNLTQMVDFVVPGSLTVQYFQKKEDILHQAAFKRLNDSLDSLGDKHPEIYTMGKSLIKLMEGLFKAEMWDWDSLNQKPEMRALLQTTLFRLSQHIAMAENHLNDFTQFSRAIELAHSELETVLSLATPFKYGDFEAVYKRQMTFVPKELQGYCRTGLTKSAMNTFAGINSAVFASNANPVRCFGEDIYYQQVSLIGENSSMDTVLQNPKVAKVDLYVAEFNHNVSLKLDHAHYSPTNVIEDVQKILASKTGTDHLTVAVDCTIDFVNSSKVEALLKAFSKEIQEGRLNFIFFRSGQKFDMFGMDNYYGSPFYMINNGKEYWSAFNQLWDNEIHHTDPLSMQWFCLVNKYAPEFVEKYRKLVFDNTRAILAKVPKSMQVNTVVRVSTVDPKMEPSFIDIKIKGKNASLVREKLEQAFHGKFAQRAKKSHSRGSFGFMDPNLNIIPDHIDNAPRHIRINPGINPEDNALIVEFIKEIPKIVKEAQQEAA